MKGKDLSGAGSLWQPRPDSSIAEGFSLEMLDERPLACANIRGPVRSLPARQGKDATAEEMGVLFKTDAAMLNRAIARTAVLHLHECRALSTWPHGAPR